MRRPCSTGGGKGEAGASPLRTSLRFEDRDAIAAERSHPVVAADFNRNGSRTERTHRRVVDHFGDLECLRIDLHDLRGEVRRIPTLTRGENRPIARPADIVHAETEWNFLAFGLGPATRE